jgi:hypothetical protein
MTNVTILVIFTIPINWFPCIFVSLQSSSARNPYRKPPSPRTAPPAISFGLVNDFSLKETTTEKSFREFWKMVHDQEVNSCDAFYHERISWGLQMGSKDQNTKFALWMANL